MLDISDELLAFFDSAPDLLYVHDLTGRIQRVNRAFELLTGYSRDEALRMNVINLLVPERRDLALEWMFAICGGAPSRPFESEIVTRSGERVLVEVSAELIFRDGKPSGMQGLVRDLRSSRKEVDARARTEAQLFEKTSQLAHFSRYLELLHRLITTDHPRLDDLFAEYLSAGCEIFGLRYGAIVRQENGSVIPCRIHGGTELDMATATEVLQSPATICRDSCCIATPVLVNDLVYAGILFWSPLADAPAVVHPHAREIIELMAKAIGSAAHQRQLTTQLAWQAKHDALTGLPNRLLLAERLASALDQARASSSVVAVLFIDLDMFKQINDTLGHAVGDGVLEQVAHRLRTCVDSSDTLARMGGDEFTAILTRIADEASAVSYARKLLAALRTPCQVQGYELFVTASIGVSLFPFDGDDASTLLRNADTAMYSAKYRGKNDVRRYQAESTATALQRLELETHLRRALERDELRMLYQPQVDLDGKLAGLEVLLVWEHPELGRISPSQFIPIAEETGMILPIGAWVLRSACRTMAAWQRKFHVPAHIGVNVSALQFSQANLATSIAEALAESGLAAACLELELTESLVMRDVDQSAAIMREVRSLGVRIAIDDFGTGYSSLSYLRRLPADVLKVDQAFVSGIEDEASAFAIVNAIVVLGHTFGLQVTVEGVENERQLHLVRKAGCDRIQGHFFGGSLTSSQVEDLLHTASLAHTRDPAKS